VHETSFFAAPKLGNRSGDNERSGRRMDSQKRLRTMRARSILRSWMLNIFEFCGISK
jgi:hypothetical protein